VWFCAPPAAGQVTFLEGASGVLACRALLAHMQGQQQEQGARVQVDCGCCTVLDSTPEVVDCCPSLRTDALSVCRSGAHVEQVQPLNLGGPIDPSPAPHPCHCQELLGLWGSHIQGVLPDSECELLYGRAGYLYSLSWLRSQLGRDVVPRLLLKVGFTKGRG
jgi:hypothetical protein